MDTILVIDDEVALCKVLEKILSKAGYRVVWTQTASQAPDLVQNETPSCVLLDLKLADGDGLSVLSQIKDIDKFIPVIMLTAYETVKSAVEAMKRGAFYYMAKPFDNEELFALIKMAIEQRRLKCQVDDLKARLGEGEDLESLMGTSPRISEVIKLIKAVAPTDVNVLLLGESGTGKELVARQIHHLSNRRNSPFIPVDCASIPETLIESELFGHEKGAYTGALSLQKGKFELANEGTIFLDEVGNIPQIIQAKLLRFLEMHQFERVGGRRQIKLSVRVIAATNADIQKSTQDNLFRLDLFYRLNEFPISLPCLRERKEDIQFLCNRFLQSLTPEVGKEVPEISPEAMVKLINYNYPGNVRELRNIIKRAMVMASSGRIEMIDLSPEVKRRARTDTQEISVPVNFEAPLTEVSRQATAHIEKQIISEALQRTKGHHGNAAKLLGISAKTIYNKIKEYGL